jgi:hypothetical protein
MDDFFDFMRSHDVEDPEGLMLLVTQFLEDPGVINKFSKDQLLEFERRLDFALAPFRADN